MESFVEKSARQNDSTYDVAYFHVSVEYGQAAVYNRRLHSVTYKKMGRGKKPTVSEIQAALLLSREKSLSVSEMPARAVGKSCRVIFT